jgi:hypothetical protein
MFDVSSFLHTLCPMLCIVACGMTVRVDGSNGRTFQPILEALLT